jgi:metal-responsive CopG/Arc/MetJ family transcriptional regulator
MKTETQNPTRKERREERVIFHISPELLHKLKLYQHARLISTRSAAIRDLIERGIEASKEPRETQ